MNRVNFVVVSCFLLLGFALPMHAATSQCSYTFSTGAGDSLLYFCVTVNGNIPKIAIPVNWVHPPSLGEGYGICDQDAPQNYTDYGASDTGNWSPANLVSQTSSSVKITRTTADGNWTLTQTITSVPPTQSIKVVMALTNNQATTHTAYLTRWADVPGGDVFYLGFSNSATVRFKGIGEGFQLQNVGKSPFGFRLGYVLYYGLVPNACAFAYYEGSYGTFSDFTSNGGSIEMAYVGPVGPGQTRTVTLSYHRL